jgi:hypothetical protein
VTVRRRLHDGERGEAAVAADAVLHDDRLRPLLGEMVGDDARHQVRRPARRKRHDDAHRAGGIILRGGGADATQDSKRQRQ